MKKLPSNVIHSMTLEAGHRMGTPKNFYERELNRRLSSAPKGKYSGVRLTDQPALVSW